MMAALTGPSWLVRSQGAEPAVLRLFCFPYAGGGASVFRKWSMALPDAVEICAVQLPGRETRLNERPFSCLMSLVEDMSESLLPYLDRPFAFFGHSVGALIAFELARRLRRREGLVPVHLFVSGSSAPQVPNVESPIHCLPETEFLNRLRRFNGTPPEVFEHRELMDLLTPVLRADFALRETYEYASEPPLSCPISAFGGVEDLDVPLPHIEAWRKETDRTFRLHEFPGDHFFIHAAQERVLERLSQTLKELVGSA
jgi:medium-chain acyl-[acyl-carrier-protein] hydrolase